MTTEEIKAIAARAAEAVLETKVPEEFKPAGIKPEDKPCPNLKLMAEWIKVEDPTACRPCTLGPVVQWYWDELNERDLKDLAKRLEKAVENLDEDKPEQALQVCEELDQIKSEVSEELRKRLQEFDCAAQLFDPLIEGDAVEEKTSEPA